jgi:flagellar biosynthesis/type III secretory pathway chaperone
MNELIQNLVESLREELKQYGELLALLDLQQEQVVRRLAAELLETVSAISAQGEAIKTARREREQRQRDLAVALALPGEALFAQLIPLLPPAYQPLVGALVDENNQLLTRVRQRARQNHLLLRRSLELMERFLHTLCGVGASTYNELGAVASPSNPGRALYEGIC